MTSDVVIQAQELSKTFGSLRALDRVSFSVRRGEVVGFLGPNGAGKSTTMRILTCYLSATSGSAKVAGHDVFEEPLEVRRSLGYLPQRAPLYGDMNVWEYLRFVADVRQLDATAFRRQLREVVEICGLGSSLGKEIRNLSHGYRQRVGLAQALVHNPKILILDEPTSDLDPNEKAEVIRYIQEIGKERTVVLSTHNLAEVEAACARAIIVSKGRVVADGPLDEVRARSGTVRYHVVIHEQKVRASGGAGAPPSSAEVQAALSGLPGVQKVMEAPTDDQAHAFTLFAPKAGDLRPDLFELVVQKGWLLLEMRRDTKKLEDVFKALTRGDEILDRGRPLRDEALDEDEDEEDEAESDEDEPDEDDDEPDEDDDEPDEDDDEPDEDDDEDEADEDEANKD